MKILRKEYFLKRGGHLRKDNYYNSCVSLVVVRFLPPF